MAFGSLLETIIFFHFSNSYKNCNNFEERKRIFLLQRLNLTQVYKIVFLLRCEILFGTCVKLGHSITLDLRDNIFHVTTDFSQGRLSKGHVPKGSL